MCYLTPHKVLRGKETNTKIKTYREKETNKKVREKVRVVREACPSRAAASLKKIKTLTFRPVFPQNCSKKQPALLLLQK